MIAGDDNGRDMTPVLEQVSFEGLMEGRDLVESTAARGRQEEKRTRSSPRRRREGWGDDRQDVIGIARISRIQSLDTAVVFLVSDGFRCWLWVGVEWELSSNG